MKEFILYVFALLIVALMFTFIYNPAVGTNFQQTFIISVIFSFSIGFTNRILSNLLYPITKKYKSWLRILLFAPLLFAGCFLGILIGNFLCYLIFHFYPLTLPLITGLAIGGGIFSIILGSTFLLRTISSELKEETKIAKLQASIKVLQAQINPHFFFNSLASVQSLIHKNPRKAEEALAAISEVFRYSMRRGQKDFIELWEEIEFIKQFLYIEEMRLADRLKVIWNIDEEVIRCLIPPFLIQPIVENAIKYGIEKRKKGTVKIYIREEKNKLNISVSNTGKAEVYLVPEHSLENIKTRIEVIYGKKGTFEINTNGEVKVEISIPKQHNREER